MSKGSRRDARLAEAERDEALRDRDRALAAQIRAVAEVSRLREQIGRWSRGEAGDTAPPPRCNGCYERETEKPIASCSTCGCMIFEPLP